MTPVMVSLVLFHRPGLLNFTLYVISYFTLLTVTTLLSPLLSLLSDFIVVKCVCLTDMTSVGTITHHPKQRVHAGFLETKEDWRRLRKLIAVCPGVKGGIGLPNSLVGSRGYVELLGGTFFHPHGCLSPVLLANKVKGIANLYCVDAGSLGRVEEPPVGIIVERARECAERLLKEKRRAQS